MNFDFNELAKKWPAPIVARTEVGRFSGGLLNSRTLANMDCQGTGPPYKKMGKKVFYATEDLVTWMTERAEGSK